ncbi:class II fumarate hydratase [Alteromonas pelagimontana]|uniref:fumarate hydratase n=1 Tax=Alteromonas pelagimontana TaxID=1858656 RepID=A0A6M4MGZ7_9ALTE|nr:class II fumarate hydratase [Alteromonas pelagimontana]QJR82322.1 class II fumarate hydratase [Alteromonas pelagimontana]
MNKTLYQKETSLAAENFAIGDAPMPATFIRALGYVKGACAQVNEQLGLLDKTVADAIWEAATEVAQGQHDHQFPVDVFQTGSGTSTNMNANEVIASLASEHAGRTVHPNDDVNKGQSSNDVIPTTIHVSALIESTHTLMPAIDKLCESIEGRMVEFETVIKTGRTHLMDAMPVTVAQEMSGWYAQLKQAQARLSDTHQRLSQLAIGGTAVGTGVNTHPEFAARVASVLTEQLGITFTVTDNHFAALSAQDTAVEFSGQLSVLAVAIMKISNDLRWMNSGPLAGLGEIALAKLQAGSSIMPGKVNPVIPEAAAMAAAQVMGYHTAVTVAGQSGNFQLNVMLPLIANNILRSIQLLANSCNHLSEKAINTFTVNTQQLSKVLAKNPILVTALNQRIGYEKGGEIAKRAYQEKRDIFEVAQEMTDLDTAELKKLLDPANLV